MRSKAGLAGLILLAACVVFGQEEQKSKIQNTPQWEKRKTLVGSFISADRILGWLWAAQ